MRESKLKTSFEIYLKASKMIKAVILEKIFQCKSSELRKKSKEEKEVIVKLVDQILYSVLEIDEKSDLFTSIYFVKF